MSWLESVTADTVVVHTRDGRSIRGVLVGAYRTEVVLAHASLLHAGVAHHLVQDNGTYLCLATTILIIGKFLTHRDRWSPKSAPIR